MRGRKGQKDPRVLRDPRGRRVSGVHRELGDRVLLDPRDLPARKVPPDLQVLMALTVPMERRARRASRGRKGRRDPQGLPGHRAQRDREGSTWTTPPEH